MLTDGWTVERIIPMGDDCYNALMYQEASEIRVALLFNPSEMEYKILYLHDDNVVEQFSPSEAHYMSQFDWVPFDREEKATAADRIDNPFEEIYEAEPAHCLGVVVVAYERENGYTGHWKVQEFYGDVPCFNSLLTSDDRMVWICLNVGSHEYIAETFYHSETKPIQKPIIQYEETDWQFCKRMANHWDCRFTAIPCSVELICR